MTDFNNDQVAEDVPGARGERVPRVAALLGAAGLLPVVGAVVAIVCRDMTPGGYDRASMTAAAEIGYAMLIFNFLGGLWWGLAAHGRSAAWIYVASVVPTLLTLCLIAGAIGEPNMPDLMPRFGVALGVAILLTLPIDRTMQRRGFAPGWWMNLRMPLSICLGGGTIAVALLTLELTY